MGEQASMKPFATLLQATVVVLAVVFVFATDVAAGPDDGLPVEDLATEEGPNGEVSQASAALVADQLQTDVQATSSGGYTPQRYHNPFNPFGEYIPPPASQFTCARQCIKLWMGHTCRGCHGWHEFCCACGRSIDDWQRDFDNLGSAHHYSNLGKSWVATRNCFERKKDFCEKFCWNRGTRKDHLKQWVRNRDHGEILAEKSPAASRKDSLGLEDLLAGVRGDDTDKEDTDSLTDVQARVHDGICRPPGGPWG